MPFDVRISGVVILGVVVILGLVLRAPALTSGGGRTGTGMSEAAYQTLLATEQAHCRSLDAPLNCACYAHISGQIIASARPRVPGARYADQRVLARTQAGDSC